jgi:CrcB protein
VGELKGLIGVMAGGALGAAARFALGGWVQRKTGAVFPWGTMVINLTGCLLLGIYMGLQLGGRFSLPPPLTRFFAIGFVGAYTTFSTFAVETVVLIEERSLLFALGNVGASVLVGLAAAALGILLGRQF